TDPAGNTSGEASVTVDAVVPVLSITDNVEGIVGKDGKVTFTFTFSEAVNDFDAADIQVTGGVAGQFTQINSNVYTLEVTPPANGTVGEIVVTVAAGAAHDKAGNPIQSVSAQQAYDLVAPGTDA
ncbi:Ig-like domain-containing protein, partial [Comamonas sp. NoAH]|uniref:Ig-like domain-containing protein n=1 Tax=Comamonas halotolerans TaxID=3041496 RepID=UPI0024E15989